MLLAATNRPDLLDPALLRSGRFGRHIEVPLPNKTSRTKIFEIHLKDKPLADDVNIDEFAEALNGYTGADIKGICEEATLLAIRRGVYECKIDNANPQSFQQVKIKKVEFEEAIKIITGNAERAKNSYRETILKPSEELYR